ncbi:MAG: hypothetical protein NTX02_05190 [Planctomycetia bacterium]|nr:hypothetical protein [Planctomycetia bacterium]
MRALQISERFSGIRSRQVRIDLIFESMFDVGSRSDRKRSRRQRRCGMNDRQKRRGIERMGSRQHNGHESPHTNKVFDSSFLESYSMNDVSQEV